MEAVFINISVQTASGKIVYHLNKRVTNQQVLADCLQDLKKNLKVRVAIKEQPQFKLE